MSICRAALPGQSCQHELAVWLVSAAPRRPVPKGCPADFLTVTIGRGPSDATQDQP